VERVLAEFPLDGKPWERVVAISFLETKAYRGALEMPKSWRF
jgi:hypothetical protein